MVMKPKVKMGKTDWSNFLTTTTTTLGHMAKKMEFNSETKRRKLIKKLCKGNFVRVVDSKEHLNRSKNKKGSKQVQSIENQQ